MTSVSHITPTNLLEHLLKIGFFKRHGQHDRVWKVGLCVSGGPDSMALAYLIKNMPHPYVDGMKAFSPRAFVIDHGARHGSYEEAVWVKDQLKILDIKTDIRSIKWPSSIDPASTEGFENKARSRRYGSLALMTRKFGCEDLFTGHHEDDQVETTIVRLIRDRTINPLTFRGMQTTSPLPCGQTNVYTSSYSIPLIPTRTELTDKLQREAFHFGIQLHRPLLDYRKNDLIATCDHFKVPYVQDKTNFDPQLTVRNAVRHLRTNYTLPRALQTTSLLNTVSNVRTVRASIEEQAHKFLDYILNFQMYHETGVIILRLKPLPLSMDGSQLRGLSFFFQRIVNLVSPANPTTSFAMLDREHTERLYDFVSRPGGKDSILFSKVICSRSPDTVPPNDVVLSFSRQPLSQAEKDTLTNPFDKPDLTTESRPHDAMQRESRPISWDRRLWIRVKGESDVIMSTLVRPYNESDVPEVMAALRLRNMDQAFRKFLSIVAPGHIRFTLPVLVVSGKIVAFPTLDLEVVPSPPISWSIRYARDQESTHFFFPDIKHKAVISWKFDRSMSNTDQNTDLSIYQEYLEPIESLDRRTFRFMRSEQTLRLLQRMAPDFSGSQTHLPII